MLAGVHKSENDNEEPFKETKIQPKIRKQPKTTDRTSAKGDNPAPDGVRQQQICVT